MSLIIVVNDLHASWFHASMSFCICLLAFQMNTIIKLQPIEMRFMTLLPSSKTTIKSAIVNQKVHFKRQQKSEAIILFFFLLPFNDDDDVVMHVKSRKRCRCCCCWKWEKEKNYYNNCKLCKTHASCCHYKLNSFMEIIFFCMWNNKNLARKKEYKNERICVIFTKPTVVMGSS